MAKKQKGLTLVELMVTLAVAIILIAVGLPLFSGVADNNRMTAQVNALSSALQLARSEAVKTGNRVNVCPKADDDQADFYCGDQDDWANGWMVYRGATVGLTNEVGQASRVRIWPEAAGTEIVTTVSEITFVGTGARDDAGVSTDDREWTMRVSGCSTGAPLQREITVRPVGQIQVERGVCP